MLLVVLPSIEVIARIFKGTGVIASSVIVQHLTLWIGFSGAIIAARKNKESIEMSDFQDAIDRVIGGLEKKNKIISPEEKKSIESGISDLKSSLKGADTEDIKKKTQSLIQVSMKLGEAVYKTQQKPVDKDKGGGDPKDAKPSEKDNVVDADFEDVKEDKEKSA